MTLLGDVGFWRERIYLAGGLAPRYLIGQLPEGARAHVGTTDIDLVIGIALGDETPETYWTLQNNLEKSGFKRSEPSFRWVRDVDGITVKVEFLCETDAVESGAIFNPKGEKAGSKLAAFNVRGALLARDDFVEREIEAERLDGGGKSRVHVRVANVLPYTVLKIFSFQDRHENKDAYDLIFTLFNHNGGPDTAGRAAAQSAVAAHEQVGDGIALLAERFAAADLDGPSAYALFLADPDDTDEAARLRQEAVVTVREFLAGFNSRTAGMLKRVSATAMSAPDKSGAHGASFPKRSYLAAASPEASRNALTVSADGAGPPRMTVNNSATMRSSVGSGS